MKISVLTMMPGLFGDFLKGPVIERAVRKGALEIQIIDIRNYAPGSFRHIDDSPFGGGAGMVMRCQPVLDALRACRGELPSTTEETLSETGKTMSSEAGGEAGRASSEKRDVPSASQTVILAPAGIPYTQKKAHEFAKADHLILICGHYEGMDARIYPHADEMISIGDYVLTGGELAAQVVIDSVVRLLPGSLREASTVEESFENGLLEYPHYTQPAVYEGEAVPEVLRSGDHERIRKWRLQQSLLLTKKVRPDLFAVHELTAEEKHLLEEAEE